MLGRFHVFKHLVKSFSLFADQREHLLLLADVMTLAAAEESTVRANTRHAAGQADQFFSSLMLLADAQRLLHFFLSFLLNLFLLLIKAVLEVE